MVTSALHTALDTVVENGLPGVIAGVTDATTTRFLASRGVSQAGGEVPLADDAVFTLYSASKPITATAALQCVEEDLIDLDAPASTYLPELGTLEVLESIAADGTVRTRPPRTPITVRTLLLHTSGIAYDMFNSDIAQLSRALPQRTSRALMSLPLVHDPGERWTYGMSIDWLGLLVQEVRQQRLEDVLRTRIFEQCGMTSTSFDMPPALRERFIPVNKRRADGTIVSSRVEVPEHAELDLGGQGLFSNAADYLAFLRVWLGDGDAPHGRVLREDTVAWAVQAAPGIVPTSLQSTIPSVTGSATFADAGWAYSFLRASTDSPAGRRAGTLSWAGLSNVHFWIDRASNIAAVWSGQLLPWQDPLVAAGLRDFERAVYAN